MSAALKMPGRAVRAVAMPPRAKKAKPKTSRRADAAPLRRVLGCVLCGGEATRAKALSDHSEHLQDVAYFIGYAAAYLDDIAAGLARPDAINDAILKRAEDAARSFMGATSVASRGETLRSVASAVMPLVADAAFQIEHARAERRSGEQIEDAFVRMNLHELHRSLSVTPAFRNGRVDRVEIERSFRAAVQTWRSRSYATSIVALCVACGVKSPDAASEVVRSLKAKVVPSYKR